MRREGKSLHLMSIKAENDMEERSVQNLLTKLKEQEQSVVQNEPDRCTPWKEHLQFLRHLLSDLISHSQLTVSAWFCSSAKKNIRNDTSSIVMCIIQFVTIYCQKFYIAFDGQRIYFYVTKLLLLFDLDQVLFRNRIPTPKSDINLISNYKK